MFCSCRSLANISTTFCSSQVKSLKCSSHQTSVLLSDNSMWSKGVLKEGWGRTEYDFVRVKQFEEADEVDIYGGHSCVAVVAGKEAFYVELHHVDGAEEEVDEYYYDDDGDGDGDEAEEERGGEEEGGEVNPHFRPVDFLPEEGLGGKIVGVETGWRHGVVLVDNDS